MPGSSPGMTIWDVNEMVEYCFETVNWSPYLGFEKPDLPGMIRAAAATGYRWISFDQPSIAYYVANAGTLDRLRDDIESHGLKMLAVHSLAINEDVAEVEKLAREAVETGASLGAQFLHAGVIAPIDDRVIEATRRANAICIDAGQEMAMEFLPMLPLASIGQTHALLDAAGVTGRNFVVDTWHFFNGPDGRSSGGWDALRSIPADRMAYVQFNDHGALESDDLMAETIHKRRMPGDGIFDLKQFADTIKASGFDGIVGPELLSSAYRDKPLEDIGHQLMETTAPYWR
jgi:sugar phosphate isomerase/epimerase